MTAQAIEAECFETPDVPIKLILERELLGRYVIDPCCGRGQLADAALAAGYSNVVASDLYDWGYGGVGVDFLDPGYGPSGMDATVFMNPPFSLACQFIEKAWASLRVRKIVCYQRFAWYESRERRDFWHAFPPNRIYTTESRWDCWRIDIPPSERKGSRPYPHAWYVWERGQPAGTLVGRLEAA